MRQRMTKGGVAEFAAAIALGAGALLVVGIMAGSAPAIEAPWVTDEVAHAASMAAPPATPTLTDAIRFYEDRLSDRGDDAFVHRQLTAINLLRFRAYGDASDLRRAEAHAVAAGEAGSPEATQAGVRSSLHLVRHEFSDALREARRAVALSTKGDATARWRLFDALWAVGRTGEAEELLRAEKDSVDIGRLSREARVLDAGGEVSEARDRFRVVVREAEAFAESPAVRAWAEVELGHFENHSGSPGTAVVHFRRALEILPGSPAALEGLASIAFGADRNMDAAVRLYSAALANGGHLDIMPRLAEAEEERGSAVEAARIRRDFIALATADEAELTLYRRPLAQLLADTPGTVCQAIELARVDLEERQDAGAFATMAWTLYNAGTVEAAMQFAANVLDLASLEPQVAWRVAVVLNAGGRTREARDLMQEALDGQAELSPQQVRIGDELLKGLLGAPEPVRCDAR